MLNGTTEQFIVVSIENEVEKPVYVYEFSAHHSSGVADATKYDDAETALSVVDVLTQMSTLQGEAKELAVKKVTTIIESVEREEA